MCLCCHLVSLSANSVSFCGCFEIDEYASVIFGLFIISCLSGNLSVQLKCVTAHKFQPRSASLCSDAD